MVVLLAPPVGGFRHYQKHVPNGADVRHPCIAFYTWHGLGHYNRNGGGDRNPFGRDFAANGMVSIHFGM